MQKLQIFFEKIKNWQIALIVFFFGLILYANTFNNQLFWDDYDSIIKNQYIRDWNYFPKYFSENLTSGSGIRDNYWRPLLLVSFSIDYHIAGLNPFVYHFQNFLWHFFSAFLVYLIIFKFFKDKLPAFFAALIFLSHPLQTEAVSYTAGRADPMQTALLLLSFWFFLKYIWEKISLEPLIFSLFFLGAALLTKERAIIFPAIIFVYFFTLYFHSRHILNTKNNKQADPKKNSSQRSERKLINTKVYLEKISDNWKIKSKILLPFFIIICIYFVLRLTALHFTNTFDLDQPNNIGANNFGEKLLIYFKGISVYFGLLFWPAKLYMEKIVSLPRSVFDFSVISGFILTVLSFVSIFYSLQKKKIVAFGMLWFWIAFSPSFYIYPIQGLLYEHWLYFPLIGLLICSLVPLFDYFSQSSSAIKIFILIILIVFIGGFSARTIIRNNDWENPITFYEKNISLGGYSGRVYTNLGMAYADAGRNQEAIDAYQKAIAINPDLFQTWYDMGNAFVAIGKNDEAVAVYQKAIEKNPYFVPSYNNLAKILSDQEKFDEATLVLQKAIEKNPQDINLLYNLGVISNKKGDKLQARKYFQEALNIDPINISLIKAANNL